jgi:hypothetical protein
VDAVFLNQRIVGVIQVQCAAVFVVHVVQGAPALCAVGLPSGAGPKTAGAAVSGLGPWCCARHGWGRGPFGPPGP